MKRVLSYCTFLLCATCVLSSIATASTVLMRTPAGSSLGGKPVNVEATFETSENLIAVSIVNNLANPNSVIQVLNGIAFLPSSPVNSPQFQTQSTAHLILITGTNVLPTDRGTGPVGWNLSVVNGRIKLGGASSTEAVYWPANTLIGNPGPNGMYTNANGGLISQPHNPFIQRNVSFQIAMEGVTATTGISNATFYFGTSSDWLQDVPGGEVPEPAAVGLAACGLAVLLYRVRRRI